MSKKENTDHTDDTGLLGRNYILLWLGQFVSQMGNRLYLMALAWYFVSVADDSAGLFTVFIVSSLPSLFLGPFHRPACGAVEQEAHHGVL